MQRKNVRNDKKKIMQRLNQIIPHKDLQTLMNRTRERRQQGKSKKDQGKEMLSDDPSPQSVAKSEKNEGLRVDHQKENLEKGKDRWWIPNPVQMCEYEETIVYQVLKLVAPMKGMIM
ncbi:hypothetical protein Salat_1478800 [Sesamum alatum]|uniref:Uncharacterized protein n=1 Tax=Sesamum alatum TaxID=300844 RepID=A0AAE2CM94_9LAMI|nr:hypothetical protein Salat_1478800 [Sesamum alatum]